MRMRQTPPDPRSTRWYNLLMGALYLLIAGLLLYFRLGPVDGLNLPPVDLERVAVGSLAPDFSLQTISGDTLTLSSFRGARNVVLVFYRGHW